MDAFKTSKLFRLSDVSELTSLGKTTIKLWVAQGRFPPPVTLSKTIKVWHQRDIENWVNSVGNDASLTEDINTIPPRPQA